MTDMPQMIALYNGMGGGAAAAIAAVELYRAAFANAAGAAPAHSTVVMSLAVIGGIIGAISFSGSLIAWAKLQGVINKTLRFGGQKFVNGLLFLGSLAVGVIVVLHHGADPLHVSLIFALALLFGVAMTLPIGGADMPGGHLAVQRAHRSRRGLRRLRDEQRGDDHRRHRGGLGGHAAHAAHGQGHEPLAGQCAVLGFRVGRRRAATAVSGSMKPIEASDVGVDDGLRVRRSSWCRATAWRSRRPSTRSGKCASCSSIAA